MRQTSTAFRLYEPAWKWHDGGSTTGFLIQQGNLPLPTSYHFPLLPQPTAEESVTFGIFEIFLRSHRHPPTKFIQIPHRIALVSKISWTMLRSMPSSNLACLRKRSTSPQIQLMELSRIPSIYKCRTLPAKLQSHRGQHLAKLATRKDFFMPPTSGHNAWPQRAATILAISPPPVKDSNGEPSRTS